MPSGPQFRAGREVAEDVKRAVKRAIHAVGLKEHRLRMVLGKDQSARLVMGGGKPDGWPYDLAPLSVEILVTTTGDVLPAKVFCKASDQDPIIAAVGGGLSLKDCHCELAELPKVLKDVWCERQELLAKQGAGEKLRDFTGRWHWAWTQLG